MRLVPKLAMRWTIRRRIGLAFTAISAVTLTLGLVFVNGAHLAGQLVTRTFDQTVNTTVYARAASSDFASMRAELAHGLLSKDATRRDAMARVQVLSQSFRQDLATAVETSRSAEIADIAKQLLATESEWIALSHRIASTFEPDLWNAIEAKAQTVERGVETMVGKVAEDGFAGRQAAQQSVAHNTALAFGGMTLAVLICGTVAFFLARRISAPLDRVARFAQEIARGKLDGEAPHQSSDEIGDLNRAMVSMRRDIRAMMEEQAVLQAQSQARVAEALDGSSEGVVIVDATGTVQIANAKALDVFGLTRADVPVGLTARQLAGALMRPKDDRSGLLPLGGGEPRIGETLLPDGRWIRHSCNHTAEGGLVALYTDVTAMRAQRDALAAANQNLDGALANMSQGLSVFDAENRLTLANPQFYAISGLHPDEVGPGADYLDVVRAAADRADPAAAAALVRRVRAAVRRGRGTTVTTAFGTRTLAMTLAPMPEGGWLATLEDVTERQLAEGRIAFLATHDDLTKLPNRTLFAERVEQAIGRARRGQNFAIHCLDLDHFKQVNDTLGHALGDALLREVTWRLRNTIRDVDTVARLGGDEFAVLQVNVADDGDCARLAQALVDAVSAPYTIQGHDVVIGVSVGISRAPANGLDHGRLLKGADAALYRAKELGRGSWQFFENNMEQALQARREIEHDLRHATGNGELEVYYQPLLDVATMEIRSFEALVRWNHPTKGLVPPNAFIPIAEETGIINEMGRWVMRTACRQAAAWGVRIAVNVSAVQLRDPGFTAMVEAALADSGLPVGRLELEITESVFMDNSQQATSQLLALRQVGVHFAMDDFGTGYSSLSNLRSFPFSRIKIDLSFVRDLGQKNGAEQIIRTILMLGKTLGIQVTAEGVENRKQLKFLEDEGCDTIQGYLVGRPLRAPQVPEVLGRPEGLTGARSAA